MRNVARGIWGVVRQRPAVITLSKNHVHNETTKLAKIVEADGFTPSHIVAIANGGIPIGDVFAEYFSSAEYVVVKQQRPSTAVKNDHKLFSKFLQKLPQSVTAALRRFEHWMNFVELDFNHSPAMAGTSNYKWPEISIPPTKVLIVDDAVDSGISMQKVIASATKHFGPNAEIRTAVLNVSGANPFATANYYAMKDILVRFYWSNDYVS